MAFDLSKYGSWKTTLIGLITALAAWVDFDPSLFSRWPWITSFAKFVMIGGFAAFGLAAKDSNVTGGTIANTKNNPNVVAETAAATAPVPPLPPPPAAK